MNSTSKFCKIAQRTLNFLLKIIPVDQFKDLKKKMKMKKDGKIKTNLEDKKKDFDDLLEILIAYSEKHIKRTQNFIKKSFYLDFMLNKLNLFNFEEGNQKQ